MQQTVTPELRIKSFLRPMFCFYILW